MFKKLAIAGLCALSAAAFITGCGSSQKPASSAAASAPAEKKEITVGATAGPHAEVVEAAAKEAEKNGLVDGFGGLSDAVALAADRAGIAADFRVYEILSEPDSFAAFLSMFSARMQRFSAACVHGELGEAFVHYDMLSRTLREDGVMALMPYTISFE